MKKLFFLLVVVIGLVLSACGDETGSRRASLEQSIVSQSCDTTVPTPTPEPGTIILLGIGSIVAVIVARKK